MSPPVMASSGRSLNWVPKGCGQVDGGSRCRESGGHRLARGTGCPCGGGSGARECQCQQHGCLANDGWPSQRAMSAPTHLLHLRCDLLHAQHSVPAAQHSSQVGMHGRVQTDRAGAQHSTGTHTTARHGTALHRTQHACSCQVANPPDQAAENERPEAVLRHKIPRQQRHPEKEESAQMCNVRKRCTVWRQR